MTVLLEQTDFENIDLSQPVILQIEKRTRIKELKIETSKRIQTFGGKYYNDIDWLRKSQNCQDAKTDYFVKLTNGETPNTDEIAAYNLARELLLRKDRYVARHNEIESLVNSLSSIDDVIAFDVTDNQHWVGLD